MKKILALMLAAVLALSLVACGGGSGAGDNNSTNTPSGGGDSTPMEEEPQEEVQYYKIGDTVSTDIFEFTLDEASLTIALCDVFGENYFTAKEYDAEKDAENRLVAPKGHTYVAFTYTVKNLDRARAEFLTHRDEFVSAEYNGIKYGAGNDTLEDGAYYLYQDRNTGKIVAGKQIAIEANIWTRNPSRNFLLNAGEKETRRAYLDMSVDVNSLTDEFKIIVKVPNSDKTETSFTYLIPAK